MNFAVSAPANLLLAGEYAIIEEGGPGLALASTPRARAEVRPVAGGLRIEGRMGPTRFSWEVGAGDPPALVAACLSELGSSGIPTGHHVAIDTSDFFAADGSKRGFGSSAATAVCLTASLLRLRGLEGPSLDSVLFPAALSAHRRAQGGRGSGYDVAASYFGGAGIFTGGTNPGWTPLGVPSGTRGDTPQGSPLGKGFVALLDRLELTLAAGPRPVSSSAAVARCEAWKLQHYDQWTEYRRESARLVGRLASAESPESFLAFLAEATRLGARLGEAIGVPALPVGGIASETGIEADPADTAVGSFSSIADSAPVATAPSAVAKCLGAGDELELIAALRDTALGTRASLEALAGGRPLQAVRFESEGLRWE